MKAKRWKPESFQVHYERGIRIVRYKTRAQYEAGRRNGRRRARYAEKKAEAFKASLYDQLNRRELIRVGAVSPLYSGMMSRAFVDDRSVVGY